MNNRSDIKSIEDLPPIELDKVWIEVFGEPYRDAEMLSWENLKWNGKEIIHID